MMNTINGFFKAILFACITLFSFQSCLEDDAYSLGDQWQAMATVVPYGDKGEYYFRLDDQSTLWVAATNHYGFKAEEETRAMILFTYLSDSIPGFSHAIKLNFLDPILTKPLAEDLGTEKNDSIYGVDEVEISEAWTGDGYLHINFIYNHAGKKAHYINLLPYVSHESQEVVFDFRHNAYEDIGSIVSKGIAAFKISSLDVEADYKIKIKYNSPDGTKEYQVSNED